MKDKILMFVDDYSGGAGNVMQILANEFHRHDTYEPVVVFLNSHSKNLSKLDSEIQVIDHVDCYTGKGSKILWLFNHLRFIYKLIKAEAPKCIISFLNNTNTSVCLSMFFNSQIPIIVSERSNPIEILPTPKFPWYYLQKIAYIRANLITVQCNSFQNFMPVFKNKIKIAPNPILKPSISKHDYEFKDTIKLVTCCRLHKIKQIDLMIQAFKIIYDKNNSCRLYIYGDGKERTYLENLIKTLKLEDVVYMPGSITDVYKVLCNSDIYLMTSKQEGFPNALSEAMAIGLPCVTFECHKGLYDIIENKKNGIVVKPNDINDLASNVQLLIADAAYRKAIGNNAKKVTDKFSKEKIYNLWKDLINSTFI